MEIRLAKSYGFCFGVKRAIKIAEESKNSNTLGPLIHNKREIKRLEEKYGVKVAETSENLENGADVIIRTHGIPKNDLENLREKNFNIIDATCPFVTKPQQIVEQMSKEGYDIVIFGDIQHPEIKGVMSYAENPHVILDVSQIQGKRLKEKVAVVAQTTRKIDEYLKIVDYLVKNYKEVRVFNTICNATFENQSAAKDLSKEADVMIVVGGKNSSNTKQLYNICKENCEDSYLVEDENELKKEWFENKKICGITAGASTPDWIIEKIIGKIRDFKV
ncbi:4-hydroxy-3-methylbut-2-enyl diphosphate reductase [Nitrosophilus alvini]|uniref:4-hydroxy-3-methylbut-2-enyl diphosphate reductase n=1 Tax=Nitrosophilus alvini TaxID=2714855 RepID=UPI00190C58BB|nr:4-hydroxy-3-methylbut-2-enyl diphosphate reductase [Nitrosophilus alvini]